MNTHDLTFTIRQVPHVVLGLGHQLHLLLDAVEPSRDEDGERQVGVRARIRGAVLDACRRSLLRLVEGNAHESRAIQVAPAHVGGSLSPAPQALVGVDMLVGDGRDLLGVREKAGDELAPRRGQAILARRGEKRVLFALEQRQVRVHARAGVLNERLGHERRDELLA